MNLSEYEKLEKNNVDNYVRFTQDAETKYLRFLYLSGGENMGEDIEVYRKKWDEAAKKYVYDAPDGQLVVALKCIEYDEGGGNPRIVRWERSAYFCKNTLLPMWKNYPRIIDGVWKVTATSPKTIDAAYALFPVLDADTVRYPIIEDSVSVPVVTRESRPADASKPKKKYWEE